MTNVSTDRDQIIAGLRELLRKMTVGDAGPLDYILAGEIIGWWRHARKA